MIISTALLLSALCAGTPQESASPASPAAAPSAGQQRMSTGLVLAASVEGRIAIFDSRGQFVVELDKPAGRPLEVALEPGAYEVSIRPASPKVVRFQIGDGDRFVLEAPRLDMPSAPPPAPPGPQQGPPPAAASGVPAPARLLDARHRIEVRFGGWVNGWADGDNDWDYSGSAHGAFGFEYLRFLRNDLGVGLALTTIGEAEGWSHDLDDHGAAQALVSVPVVVRWYPLRRHTQTRAVEPYVTAGIGPVFGVTSAWTDDGDPGGWNDWQGWNNWPLSDDRHGSGHGVSHSRVSMAFGGRLGGGIDFRLGPVFTLGLAGAWNWSTGFADDLWYRPDSSGGEFTFTLGWQFGR